ncbi:hypothetical protein [Bacillus altitudinis]|uniref:hypothetical protein n=1 Tax=Bacillus altitudinis TaxID=293387 RepID=UPI00202082A6|nr:hypothetical protein [Bacillus altitudinis]MCL7871008.1 hypothetical protein [Bacillus altitudinis]
MWLLLLVWIVTISLISINLFASPTSFFTNGTTILGWMLFALQLSYRKSEMLFIFCQKIYLDFKNPDCSWNMDIEFTGDFSRDIFKKIDSILLKDAYCKMSLLSNTRRRYKVKTIHFEVSLDEYHNKLNFFMDDLDISYRRSKKIIQNEIGTLLDEISAVLKPDNSLYAVDIKFKKSNPYYGYYLKKIHSKNIKEFNINFKINEDNVIITKDSFKFTATSLHKLSTYSKKYLTISPS